MHNPTVILLPPCKDNIFYQVLNFESIEVAFRGIVHQFLKERTNYKRTIIYCRTIEECATLYLYFRDNMGKNFTEPPNAPAIAHFRMVDMFTSCVDDEIKSHIIHSFTQPSCLRIVCATVAFGMGLIARMLEKLFIWVLRMMWSHIYKRLDVLGEIICHL